MKNCSAILMEDFYKVSHKSLYVPDTEMIYSTWTPRMSRLEGVDKVVCFGIQGFIKRYLVDYFNENFFSRPKDEVVNEYKRVLKYALGNEKPDVTHIEQLHDLGYLPLTITAIEEGTRIPIRTPMMAFWNTDKRFFWLTNFIETLLSAEIWLPMTSATQSYGYRTLLNEYAEKTGGDKSFVQWQGHDFSMRGMTDWFSASKSGAGHLLSFTGTDTIPAIWYLEEYYNANIEKELVGASIPATEHSVMCSYGDMHEIESFEHIITKVHPSGMVSIVSDTWDFWKVITEYLPKLKTTITERNGKIVIRPDSGDPVKIICGDPTASEEWVRKGAVECLWDTFGGTITSKGYKQLDSHIGLIYGDAITWTRCKQICEILEKKGFASTNVVYGIGSYTFQYQTRDTFGFAVKSTNVKINGKEMAIFKDPKTDSGFKKSQKGCVVVSPEGSYIDGYSLLAAHGEYAINELKPVFSNGNILRFSTLAEVRSRLYSK